MKRDIYTTMNTIQEGIDALLQAETHFTEAQKNLADFPDYQQEAQLIQSGNTFYAALREATKNLLSVIEAKERILSLDEQEQERHSQSG